MAKLTKEEIEAVIYKLQDEVNNYNSNLKKEILNSKTFKEGLKRFKLFMDQYETQKSKLNILRESLMPFYTYPYLNPIQKTEEELRNILINHHLKGKLKSIHYLEIKHEIVLLRMSSQDINSIMKVLRERIFK